MAAIQLPLASRHRQHQLRRRCAVQQMPECLRRRRVAPMRIVEHHLQWRSPGGLGQHRADTVQQPVTGPLGGHHPIGCGLRVHPRVLTELRHERRELRTRRRRQGFAPSIVSRTRQLANRPHPRLKRDHRLRGHRASTTTTPRACASAAAAAAWRVLPIPGSPNTSTARQPTRAWTASRNIPISRSRPISGSLA